MRKRIFKIRRLTSEEKTNLGILATVIIMAVGFLFILYCLMKALEVSLLV
jgi:hypothetical protein